MTYRIQGLSPALFADMIGAASATLATYGAERHTVASKPGAPCRISLEDAEIGETVLLLSHRHLVADTPYAQSGPIFIREIAKAPFDAVDMIAPALAVRTLSLRGFSAAGTMLDADLTEGKDAPALIEKLFANPQIAFIHAHFARRGCFAGEIKRA